VPFGQGRASDNQEKPTRMTWNGTEERARKIVAWGKDEALLPLVQAIPPSRDAAPDTPGAEWQMKAKVAVMPEMGGGEQWVDVPKGSVIRNTNTGATAWIDPALVVVTASGAAAAFTQE
jgi:hypothetical protein